MDLIQNFQDSTAEHHSDNDVATKQRHNTQTPQTTGSENSSSHSFDCSICFDSAHDPVVTLCGHLYCWACIFKWLNVQPSSDSIHHQSCPVCKADISQASLIPLYSHGPSHTESNPTKIYPDHIPPRPTVCGLHTLFSAENQQRRSQETLSFDRHHDHATISSSNLVSTTTAGIINPTIGLLGELVYSRMYGNADARLFTYPLPSSYAVIGQNNPRMRRQEFELDKSLNRVSIFLILGVLLCLFLF